MLPLTYRFAGTRSVILRLFCPLKKRTRTETSLCVKGPPHSHVFVDCSTLAASTSHRSLLSEHELGVTTSGGTNVLVGAGDIADCRELDGAVATAKLLDNLPGTIFAAAGQRPQRLKPLSRLRG
jgi:hypothetical protein